MNAVQLPYANVVAAITGVETMPDWHGRQFVPDQVIVRYVAEADTTTDAWRLDSVVVTGRPLASIAVCAAYFSESQAPVDTAPEFVQEFLRRLAAQLPVRSDTS